MTEQYFNARLRQMYAAFGKAFPTQPVRDEVFRRLADLPDDFMDFALLRLENEVSMPLNLGRYLACELWPLYEDAHLRLAAQKTQQGCHRCRDNIPGLRRYWKPDGSPAVCRCVCSTDARTSQHWTPTDQELLSLDCYLENPNQAPAVPWSWMPRHVREALGYSEPVREAHAEYLDSMDAEVF